MTGGSGFLGRSVVARVRARVVTEVLIPRRDQFDLAREGDAERMYSERRPDVVLRLAAEVGGIGANQANPGRYFFANMGMALHLIEGARWNGLRKFVQVGTICAYPTHTPVPFREGDLWNGFPEETNAPNSVAEKAALIDVLLELSLFGDPASIMKDSEEHGQGFSASLMDRTSVDIFEIAGIPWSVELSNRVWGNHNWQSVLDECDAAFCIEVVEQDDRLMMSDSFYWVSVDDPIELVRQLREFIVLKS